MTTLQDLNNLRSDFYETMKTKGQDFIEGVFKNVFNANPDMVAIKWQQFTPKVEIGELTEFCSGIEYIEVMFKGKEAFEEMQYCGPISKSLAEIPDEIFLTVFGDFVEVVATRERFAVSEYEPE